MSVFKPLKEISKKAVFRYTRLGVPKYPYNVEPAQLAALVSEIDRLAMIKGSIIEIGVARGLTTRFLCEHIRSQELDASTTYYALDTFSSFTAKDLAYEVNVRGKNRSELEAFAYNDFEVWKSNFASFSFVKAIQGDCAEFDYSTIAPLKLVFLDVDLYVPTKNALPLLYENLVDGGTILVDDVMNNSHYDGAYQAYVEFCKELCVPTAIIGNKCGMIKKTPK
jgi:Macrocin-O-methyltransferase (TylF)